MSEQQEYKTGSETALGRLIVLAGCSWALYLAITLSGQSLYEEGTAQHSLLTILGLFVLAFGLYLVSLHVALRAPQDRRLVAVIVVAAVVFRATMLFSDPIEEIDLYRYLWDGIATTSRVNPFRYSPDQVLAARADEDLPADLARLVKRRDRSPGVDQILRRVHFGELPTIYPPVAQAVFAVATEVTPVNASLWTRMFVMKAWFVGFDLATLFVLIRLLAFVSKPVGWSIAYAWCPLVLKEIANSGHLDALAVFLTTLAIYLAVRACFNVVPAPLAVRQRQWIASCAALVLALGVGAKLYPIVLGPLVFATILCRLGWRGTVIPAIVFAATMAIVMTPMWPQTSSATREVIQHQVAAADLPPLPPSEPSIDAQDPSHSLRTFLGQWEMNDFLFLLVVENLRPTAAIPRQDLAWFSVVPERWRESLISATTTFCEDTPDRAPFVVARAMTSGLFMVLAAAFAWCGMRCTSASRWLEFAFLTVAWFWLLLPTLNPWYWTWALPLVAFARNRAWLLVSGLVLLYYFRFWLVHHFPSTPVLGTAYSGPLFFDFIVVWLEFAPWLAYLAFRPKVVLASR